MARGTAAKKAWALYRAKYGTKSRSTGGRSRSSGSSSPRKKPRYLGVLGKFGIGLMGLAPPVGSAIISANRAVSIKSKTADELTIASRFYFGFASFINVLAAGFNMKMPFGTVELMDTNGVGQSYSTVVPNFPQGLWWTTTVLGAIPFTLDRVIAHVLKRAIRLPLIGNVTGSP